MNVWIERLEDQWVEKHSDEIFRDELTVIRFLLIFFEKHQEKGVGVSVDFFDLEFGEVLFGEFLWIEDVVEEEIVHFEMVSVGEDVFEEASENESEDVVNMVFEVFLEEFGGHFL